MKKSYIHPEMTVYNLKSNYELLQGSMNVFESEVNTSEDGVQLGKEERGWGSAW